MSIKRILLIDDEEDIREVTRLSLEMVGGWQVMLAASGREGLAVARLELPDAILLDVMMPELDGFATFQGLQTDCVTRSIPVIFLTAKVNSVDRQLFEQLAVRGVICKPFEPLKLAAQVAQFLGWNL